MLEVLVTDYKNLLKSMKFRKLSLIVNATKDISLFSRNMDEPIHPIFLISAKTGLGLDNLTLFLSKLPSRRNNNNKVKGNSSNTLELENNSFKFDIHEHFVNQQKKIVIAGFVNRGSISIGQKCFLGPNKQGIFSIVEIEELHCKKVPSKTALEGQFATISIKSKYSISIK